MTSEGQDITVIYPQAGHTVFRSLAYRLARAREEARRKTTVYPASAVGELNRSHLAGCTVLVVQPGQCTHGLSDRGAFSRRLSEAGKRVAVIAESVGTVFFENQFKISVDFDAMIDVGFVSQADQLKSFAIPYHFLFNGPTHSDVLAMERATASGRPLCWALVGHARDQRVRLAYDLTQALSPKGVVFLPPRGIVIQKSRGMIDVEGLHKLLLKTRFYVWESLHEFNYYESFRFREAVLAGTVPCKIDAWAGWESTGVPGIFSSANVLREAIEGSGYESLLGRAKSFYLSEGLLSEGLEGVLADV